MVPGCGCLTTARAIVVAIDLDVHGIGVVVCELHAFLLLQGASGHDVKRLIDIHRLLGGGLEVRQVTQAGAQRLCLLRAHQALALLDVDLVPDHNKGEVVRVLDVGLYQKLVTPALEIFKRLRVGHIVHQYTAVGPPVERHPETLEPLLASRVPYLHRHVLVVDRHVLRQEVGPNGRLVLLRELPVYELLHERGLSDPGVA